MFLLAMTALAMLILLYRAGWHYESDRPAVIERHASRTRPAMRQPNPGDMP